MLMCMFTSLTTTTLVRGLNAAVVGNNRPIHRRQIDITYYY